MSTQPYSDVQLDALRELANIGSGQAAASLSQLLGRPVDISVPTAAALPLEEAVAVAGDGDEPRHGIIGPADKTLAKEIFRQFQLVNERYPESILNLGPLRPSEEAQNA